MAQRVFFSFNYRRDLTRANIVRNIWLALGKGDREPAGFFDPRLWEEANKKGHGAIEKMIDDALKDTTVTAVLVGKETAGPDYVKYEIDQSIARGNGLLAVRVHEIPNFDGSTDDAGSNPLPSTYQVYDWIGDDGSKNVGSWVEEAAKVVGK
jgi:hypothetical protein